MFNFDRFKELCRKKGLKQSALYELVGKNRFYSSDLKKLKKVPMEYVEIWAEKLGTTPAYLMGETDDPEIKKEPAAQTGDELQNRLIAFYGEVKDYIDEDDIEDVKIFLQAKAERKRRKMENDKG